MDYFNDNNWVEAPRDVAPDEAVKFLIDSGAVSSETITPPETKRRKKVVLDAKSESKSKQQSKSNVGQHLDETAISEISFEGDSSRSVTSEDRESVQNGQTSAELIPKERPVVYTNAAYDAYNFLARFTGPSYVYHSQNWWRFEPDFGRRLALDAEMVHDVADYLVERQSKIDTNEANKILLALTHFCKIRVSEDLFEPTFFLNTTNGVIDPDHSPGWIACQNAIFHVPTVARFLYRGLPIPEEAICR